MGMSHTLNCGKHARLSTILSRDIAKLFSFFSLPGPRGKKGGEKNKTQQHFATAKRGKDWDFRVETETSDADPWNKQFKAVEFDGFFLFF